MKVIHIFSGKTNKDTESIQDCQDAFQIAENCFAIADGATDSGPYPEIWANMLVKHFCENPNITNENWQDWLKPIQEKWLIKVKEEIKTNKEKENNNGSWFYNNKKLTEKKLPAAAAFVGVQLDENKLNITIVGDSCMFIWQDNKLVKSMLCTKSTDIGCFTEYLASFEKDNKCQPQFIQYPIQSKKETHCILATDAFAKWIFKSIEAKENIFETLINISTQNQFEEIVANARKSEEINLDNDDVALIVVKISETKNTENKIKNNADKQKNNSRENISASHSNTTTEEPKIKENLLEKKVKRLKMSLFFAVSVCLLFGVSLIFLIVKNGNDTEKYVQHSEEANYKSEETSELEPQQQNSLSKTIDLPQGTIIYNIDNNIILTTDTIFQVEILEETDSLVKFGFVGYLKNKK